MRATVRELPRDGRGRAASAAGRSTIAGSTFEGHRSGVAQRQSIRLLTEGLWVRIPPPELHEARVERRGPRAFRLDRRSSRRLARQVVRRTCRYARFGTPTHAAFAPFSGRFPRSVGLATLVCTPFPAKEPPCQGAGRPSRDQSARCPSRIRKWEERPCGSRPLWPCWWRRDVSASRRLLTGRHRAPTPTPQPGAEKFEKIMLNDFPGEPMNLAVLPDGRVLHTARTGEMRIHDPTTGGNIARGEYGRLLSTTRKGSRASRSTRRRSRRTSGSTRTTRRRRTRRPTTRRRR